MDRMVYLAMTGAKHALEAQQKTSHNLANVNTPGFRADFDSLMSRQVDGPGRATRVYSEEVRAGSNLEQGAMRSTGRTLDVAINGDGWLAVQAADGTEAYTRRGDLRVGSGGLLETGDGHLVLGDGGPVALPPASKVEVGQDGTISVQPIGQKANTLVTVDRLKLVNPADGAVSKGDDGLFRLRGGGTAAADATVTVSSGTLESSNVNSVDALVEMIDNGRSFEAYVKLMRAAKENDENGQRLLRSGS